MGSITHLHERLRPVPLRIVSDEQVLSAAADVSSLDAAVGPIALGDALVRTGLLAVAIPDGHGGADVSNGLLAEAVARVAQSHPALARMLASHFVALEMVRNAGSEEQRHAIYARAATGLRFWAIGTAEGTDLPHFVRDGIGYRLPGAIDAAVLGEPDWLALMTIGSLEAHSLALVQRQDAGVEIVGQPVENAARLRLNRVHLAADCVLPLHRNAVPLSQALEILLSAAILLGERRRQLDERLDRLRGGKVDAGGHPDTELGALKVEIETVAALIERAGVALDVAQINATQTSVSEASRICGALRVTVSRATGEQDHDRLLSLLGRALISG